MYLKIYRCFHHNSTHIEAYMASSLEIMVIVSWGTLGGYEKGKKVFALEVRILCMTKTRGSFTMLLINPNPLVRRKASCPCESNLLI